MAKVIKYKYLSAKINCGTEEAPQIEQIFLDVCITCPTQAQFEINYPIAEKEAYGEITVEGEFDQEADTPTAQDDTDAMLIDHEYRLTLLELGITE